MTEKELKENIKNPAGGYFFYGDEDYLKEYYTSLIKRATIDDEELSPFNEYSFSDDSFTAAAFEDALSSPPMMSDLKFIKVSLSEYPPKSEKDTKKLEGVIASLKDYPDTVTVISVSPGGFDPGSAKRPSRGLKTLSASMNAVEFPLSGEAKLIRWLARHFAKESLASREDALKLMISLCGRGMHRLLGEAEKVAARAHVLGLSEVTREVVTETVTATPEEGAFELVNHVLSGNTQGALRLLAGAKRRGENPIKLLASITAAFCDLAAVACMSADGIDKKTIAAALGIHEYRVELYSRSAASISPEFLDDAVAKCAEADLKMKSASLGYVPLERLICSVGRGMGM
ncbi:MAG: DNA polymerase III subunit delta [Clostridia bacterium]|nr:DNA polymerase III subunit delta [Clostridia bacterium]